ncbi:restriction endonuclease subunit S [uncultured Campylobacter sp.]|uniref:restriction endonuclease subunit S n=1 Tax=uncultured Campylobacter sp. TaxID=218934 RepID=UPI002633FBB2|nr:restriction endonuclease subunit S [uncultured Campylobacter sp.]
MSEFKNLPSGWSVVRLGEIGKIVNGLTYSPENVSNNGLLVLRSSNINDNSIVLNNDDVYVKGISKFNKTLENDILICVRNGSKNLIGKSALITEKYKDLAFGAFMAIFRSNYNLFLMHIFKTNTFFKQVKNDLGATINSINNGNLLNFKIPLPPLDEQEKIAEILSTWDKAINLTINLIESKKQFKKALMQNLLTAKIRFPQFKDEWRAIKLGEICDISTGTSKSRFIGDGKFYIVDMGSITQDGLLNLTKTTNLSQDFLDCGDLVMPKDDIGGGKIIGKVAVIDKDNTYVLSDHIFRIKTTENSNFLAYLINSNLINKKIRREVSGTAQLGLSKRTIENLKIKLPNLKEQQKIAEVLMACDDEINLLNLKLENLKKQKQGLMQKLLSAKVRM